MSDSDASAVVQPPSYDVELSETPEKDHIWAAAEVHANEIDVPGPEPIGDTDRQTWYCPTTTIWDAHRLRELLEEFGIERVYDLGAGDCRVSLWLDRQGFEVVAYELISELVEAVEDRFWLGDMEIRQQDYYEDYDDLVGPDVAVVAFGGTNELPYVPDQGLAVQGYGETGVTAHYNGKVVGAW